MEDNIFMEDRKPITFEEYLQYNPNSRENLGEEFSSIVCSSIRSAMNCFRHSEKKNRSRFSEMRDARQASILQRIC